MAGPKTHQELIEAVCDYKKGWTNLQSASKEVEDLAGLSPDIAKEFLTLMKRDSVTKIRGYSKEPKRLMEGKLKKYLAKY
jgi:hypothetical protein